MRVIYIKRSGRETISEELPDAALSLEVRAHVALIAGRLGLPREHVALTFEPNTVHPDTPIRCYYRPERATRSVDAALAHLAREVLAYQAAVIEGRRLQRHATLEELQQIDRAIALIARWGDLRLAIHGGMHIAFIAQLPAGPFLAAGGTPQLAIVALGQLLQSIEHG